MLTKQPLDSSSALPALATGGVVRAHLQPGQRPAPFQDETHKDLKGKIREGHNKAFHDTFGAGSFDANVGDGNSYAGDMTITEATYGGESSDYYESKQKELEYVEASYRAIDIATGGDGNPYTLNNFDESYYYYDSYYDYQPIPAYDPYTGTFDTTNPETTAYLEGTRFSYSDEGQLLTIDDGMSCLNAAKKGGRAEAILNTYAEGGPQNLTNKVDEVKAAVPDEDGYLTFDGKRMHVNSPNGKQILVAQQQLAAGVEPTALNMKLLNPPPEELAAAKKLKLDLDKIPGQSPDDIFVATGSPKATPEQDTKFQTMMAKTTAPAAVNNFGQGNDLFMVTKSLQENKFAPLTRTTELSVSTTDPAAPAPTSPLLKPASPAPAPAFSV